MLERTIGALSQIYSNRWTRAAFLLASGLLPGCAAIQLPFKDSPDKEADQVVFLHKLKEKNIGEIADLMIKDFKHVGEVNGHVNIEKKKLKIKDHTNYDFEGIKHSKKIREGTHDKKTLAAARKIVEDDYKQRVKANPGSYTLNKFAASEIDKLKKGKKVNKDFLADVLDDIIDGFSMRKWNKYLNMLPDYFFHIHPIACDKFSVPDYIIEKARKTTSLVFCYTGDGNATVVYSKGKRSCRQKKFKIKDKNKVFTLDMLQAMNIAREDKHIIFTEDFEDSIFGKVNAGEEHRYHTLRKAIEYLHKHPDKTDWDDYKDAASYIISRALTRIEYLNSIKQESNKERMDEIIACHYVRPLLEIKGLKYTDAGYLRKLRELTKENQAVSEYNQMQIKFAIARQDIPLSVSKKYLSTLEHIRKSSDEAARITASKPEEEKGFPWEIPLIIWAASCAAACYGWYRLKKE
ncbi:hypothetical protein KY346_05360 [Candidatus Woesearchaeota archaeon]|nr:hypothetical protein [Candidatus Woesearchaeota archaeon]